MKKRYELEEMDTLIARCATSDNPLLAHHAGSAIRQLMADNYSLVVMLYRASNAIPTGANQDFMRQKIEEAIKEIGYGQ